MGARERPEALAGGRGAAAAVAERGSDGLCGNEEADSRAKKSAAACAGNSERRAGLRPQSMGRDGGGLGFAGGTRGTVADGC